MSDNVAVALPAESSGSFDEFLDSDYRRSRPLNASKFMKIPVQNQGKGHCSSDDVAFPY